MFIIFLLATLATEKQGQNYQHSTSADSLLEIEDLQSLVAPYLLFHYSLHTLFYSKGSPILQQSLK